MTSNKIYCITGPTAAGKTAIAIQLAKENPIEIISVDSALVYRDMNIGTAKPSLEIRDKIPHHLIDICDPTESYSVIQFCQDVHALILHIRSRGKQPLLVGGTMMYLNALVNGVSDVPPCDPVVRENIANLRSKKGLAVVYEELMTVDPISAKRLEPRDTQRIIRALEVFLSHGKSITEYWSNKRWQIPEIQILAVCPEKRANLHQNILNRTHEMLSNGFVQEVQDLYDREDLNMDLPSMKCVGYRQVWQMLDGHLSSADLAEKITIATRQLAKRQLTWLRKFKDIEWLTHERALDIISPLIQKNS